MVRLTGFKQLCVLVGATAWVTVAGAAPDTDIEFGFNNKPPLFFFEDGKANGDVVEIARQACRLAALRCAFTELPFQRAMHYLEQRRPAFAALGFSRTPEREKFVTYSEPVWRDERPVLLVRAEDKKAFQEYASLADMVAHGRYVFGGKMGNTYPIDAQLLALGPRDTRFNTEAIRFPSMLVAKRFDFTILDPAELLPALQASGIAPHAVATVSYPDMPNGSERYLLFSRSIAPEIVRKMNAALKTLRKDGKIVTLR